MIEYLCNWLIDELLCRKHREFEDETLIALHQRVTTKNNSIYDYLLRNKDLSCRIYMSEESLSDAINFRNEHSSVEYNEKKLEALTGTILTILQTKTGEFLLVSDGYTFAFSEIVT